MPVTGGARNPWSGTDRFQSERNGSVSLDCDLAPRPCRAPNRDQQAGPATRTNCTLMSDNLNAERSCTGALALRSWLLRVLGGSGGGGSNAVAPPRAVGNGAWSVFLARERCASTILGPESGPAIFRDQERELPAGVPGAVKARALEEARRTLAARALLHRIDAILGSAGIDVVVLKGGAAVARGRTIDLADVDILVVPGRARECAVLLERALGLTPDGPDPVVGGRGMTHLAPRKGDEGLPVEVHFSLRHMPDPAELRGRSVPLTGLSHVWALAPRDHLHHLVVHNAVQHPERRGIVRDISLALQAVQNCGPPDLEEVRSRLQADDRLAGPAGALLTVVTALADGRVPADPFRRSAAVGYLLAADGGRRDRRATSRRAAAAVSLVDGPSELGRLLRSAADPWELESTFEWVAALERRWPRSGRRVRIAGGLARTLLELVSAAGLAWRARRLADKPSSAPPG